MNEKTKILAPIINKVEQIPDDNKLAETELLNTFRIVKTEEIITTNRINRLITFQPIRYDVTRYNAIYLHRVIIHKYKDNKWLIEYENGLIQWSDGITRSIINAVHLKRTET